jgi:hypothetical protein
LARHSVTFVTGARSPAGRPRTSDRIEAASSTERAATRSANVLKRRASAKGNPSLSASGAPDRKGVKSRGISHAERHVVRLVRCPFNTAYTRFQREVKRLPAEKSAPRRARRAKSNGRTTLGLEKFFSPSSPTRLQDFALAQSPRKPLELALSAGIPRAPSRAELRATSEKRPRKSCRETQGRRNRK